MLAASRRHAASQEPTTYFESVPAWAGPGEAAAAHTAVSSPRLLLWTGPTRGGPTLEAAVPQPP
eukprot:3573075-Lingulodinium_polyedra.AAC.1